MATHKSWLLVGLLFCELRGGAAEPPNCHDYEKEPNLMGTSFRVYDFKTATECMKLLPITAHHVYHTLKRIEHGIGDLYSFSSIAGNSEESVQSLSGGCKMPVHAVKDDVWERLKNVKQRVLAQFELGSVEELLSSDKEIGAYEFHEDLARVFRELWDAHTVYIVPHALLCPRWQYRTEDGDVVKLRVRPNPPFDLPVIDQLRDTDGAHEEIREINGIPAFEWLKQQANQTSGNYKSLGGRLNSYVNAWREGTFDAPRPLPDEKSGTVNVVYEQGGDRVWNAKVMCRSAISVPHDAKEGEYTDPSINPRWESLKKWLEANLHLEGEARIAAFNSIPMNFAADVPPLWSEMPEIETAPEAAPEPTPSESSNKPSESIFARRLREQTWADGEMLAQWPELGDAPVFVAYKLASEKAVVLKVTSFMPPGSQPDILGMLAGMIKVYDAAVSAANEDRLILDLADNGGGAVEVANMLTMLIAPRLNNKELLCSNYGSKIGPFWQDWIGSFGGKWDDLVEASKTLSADEIEDRLGRLFSVTTATQITGSAAPLDATVVTILLTKVKTEPTLDGKRALYTAGLKDYKKLLAIQPEVNFLGLKIKIPHPLTGGDSAEGWFPFTGDVQDPATGEAFSPVMTPYTELVEKNWGSHASKYSKPYVFSCDLPFNNMIKGLLYLQGASFIKAQHQWKEIAILTNGLCGSACSLIATKLQFAEGATVFTYGGVPGEAMDSSAFAGGNVETYSTFWPQVFYAAIIGDILYGPDTPIGERLRTSGANRKDYANTLLLPMPTTAIATFNFNMMFAKEFGDDALPREFYNIPGHKHYNEWHQTSPTKSSTWEGLKTLYVKIADEDWAAVRKTTPLGVEYTCAAAPPTEPFVREWDFDVYYKPFILFAWCCCCCCCLGFWYAMWKMCCAPRSRPVGVGIPNAPVVGMEMRTAT